MASSVPLFRAQPAPQGFQYESQLISSGFCTIAGSDEVGRGPLAGPVVAASVILPAGADLGLFLDSKKLSRKKRENALTYLHSVDAAIGIGIVSPATIDEINILQASLLAMKRSIESLQEQGFSPDYILVDGKFEIPINLPQQALIKGETKSRSIAAASIAAKVTRDSIMLDLHSRYPAYNFAAHKGYPTKAHKQAIKIHGPCPEHRKSFRGVKDIDPDTP